jgi:hypothetical protein
MSKTIYIKDQEFKIIKAKKYCLRITDYNDNKTFVLFQKIYFFDEIITFKQESSYGIFTIKIIASNNNKDIILDDINSDGEEDSEKVRSFLLENLINTL